MFRSRRVHLFHALLRPFSLINFLRSMKSYSSGFHITFLWYWMWPGMYLHCIVVNVDKKRIKWCKIFRRFKISSDYDKNNFWIIKKKVIAKLKISAKSLFFQVSVVNLGITTSSRNAGIFWGDLLSDPFDFDLRKWPNLIWLLKKKGFKH